MLASRIPGSIGILGADHPGYFGVGDTKGLAGLLLRAERDAAFLRDLRRRCKRLAPLFKPGAERRAWENLLHECVKEQKSGN